MFSPVPSRVVIPLSTPCEGLQRGAFPSVGRNDVSTHSVHRLLWFDAGVQRCRERPGGSHRAGLLGNQWSWVGFCALVDWHWSEDAPQRGCASSLGKWVFASKVSSARTPRAVALPRFLLLRLHYFLEQEKDWI